MGEDLKMNILTEAKNELSCCRSKDALYARLADLCEQAGYHYDYGRSMASNARQSPSNDVADLIKHAERLEGRL